MKKMIFTLLFFASFAMLPSMNLNAGIFAEMGQTVIYDSVGGSGSITVSQNGATYTYSYSGTKMVGVQNECEFALIAYCNSSAQNITMLDGTVFNIPENSQQ
jgi:hypothetical protein